MIIAYIAAELKKAIENTNPVTLFAQHVAIKVITAQHVEVMLETPRVRKKEKRMMLGVNEAIRYALAGGHGNAGNKDSQVLLRARQTRTV